MRTCVPACVLPLSTSGPGAGCPTTGTAADTSAWGDPEVGCPTTGATAGAIAWGSAMGLPPTEGSQRSVTTPAGVSSCLDTRLSLCPVAGALSSPRRQAPSGTGARLRTDSPASPWNTGGAAALPAGPAQLLAVLAPRFSKFSTACRTEVTDGLLGVTGFCRGVVVARRPATPPRCDRVRSVFKGAARGELEPPRVVPSDRLPSQWH